VPNIKNLTQEQQRRLKVIARARGLGPQEVLNRMNKEALLKTEVRSGLGVNK